MADARGVFALWVSPGPVAILAAADGYAGGATSGHAPGRFEIALTPASSIAGMIVDASGRPVEGASVEAVGDWLELDISDAEGRFELDRLRPRRYELIAHTDQGYGRSEGSTMVGVGQHVAGVIVRLSPAHAIQGTVVIAGSQRPCPDAQLGLEDAVPNRASFHGDRQPDGTLRASGLPPGDYTVSVTCRGYRAQAYDPISITDHDVSGRVWPVDPTGTGILRGKLRTRSGEPIEGVTIYAYPNADGPMVTETSASDGAYELIGLQRTTYHLQLYTERYAVDRAGYTIAVDGGTVEHDLVLDDGGAIHGTVVDADGNPVPHIEVSFMDLKEGAGFGTTTDAAGAFAFDGRHPGEYAVSVAQYRAGTTANLVEHVTLKANQVATLRLIVEALSGAIKGRVVDATGAPVADAFVSATREAAVGSVASASQAGTRDVLTAGDGTFTISRLATASYTVLARRRGGGETAAEHIPVGSTVKLTIRPTGSIEGQATHHGVGSERFAVAAYNTATRSTERYDNFYRTGGHFTLRDLPAGQFTLHAQGDGGHGSVEVTLVDGEIKAGITIELESLVTVRGRFIDAATKQPITGSMVYLEASDASGHNIIDSNDGTFTFDKIATGRIRLTLESAAYGSVSVIRTIEPNAASTADHGDLPAVKQRVHSGDPVGVLGLTFVVDSPPTITDHMSYQISAVDPAGPAATTEIKVGDVLVTVDGFDITGVNAGIAAGLMRAPPGTALALGLQRGVTVIVTLAAP